MYQYVVHVVIAHVHTINVVKIVNIDRVLTLNVAHCIKVEPEGNAL